MKRLENDADGVAAEYRKLILGKLRQLLAGYPDRAGVRPLQAGHYHEERRFAGAGRTDQGDRLTLANLERHFLQDMYARGARAELKIDVGKPNCGLGASRYRRGDIHAVQFAPAR